MNKIAITLIVFSLLSGCSTAKKGLDAINYNITFTGFGRAMAINQTEKIGAEDACKFDGGGKLSICTTEVISITNAVSSNPSVISVTIDPPVPQQTPQGEVLIPTGKATVKAVGLGKATVTLTAKNAVKTETQKYEFEVRQPNRIVTTLPSCDNPVFVKNTEIHGKIEVYDGKTYLATFSSDYVRGNNTTVYIMNYNLTLAMNQLPGPFTATNTLTNQKIFEGNVVDINTVDDFKIEVFSPPFHLKTHSGDDLYYFRFVPMIGSIVPCDKKLPVTVDILTPKSCKYENGYVTYAEEHDIKTQFEKKIPIVVLQKSDGECRFRVTVKRDIPLQKEFSLKNLVGNKR